MSGAESSPTGYNTLTKTKEPSLPYNLSIAEQGTDRFIPFPRGFVQVKCTKLCPGFENSLLILLPMMITVIMLPQHESRMQVFIHNQHTILFLSTEPLIWIQQILKELCYQTFKPIRHYSIANFCYLNKKILNTFISNIFPLCKKKIWFQCMFVFHFMRLCLSGEGGITTWGVIGAWPLLPLACCMHMLILSPLLKILMLITKDVVKLIWKHSSIY